MLIGPFNSFHIEEVKKILGDHQVTFEVIQDPQALEKMRAVDKERGPRSRPTFGSAGDFIYMDVDPEQIQKALPHLERFGLVASNSVEDAQLLESAEYHCPSCDFTSDHPGECPTHKATLLEFSDWLDAKHAAGKVNQKGQFYFFLFVIAVIVMIMFMRMFKVF